MHELETLTAPELRRLVDAGVTTVVVPFGSVEHQGSHLPVGADALLADAVGREVARRLEAVLAPTIRVGAAEAHRSLSGTLSLSAATLADLAVGIGESLGANGFRTIVLVSTHGGNAAPLAAAVMRLNEAIAPAVSCAPRGDVGPSPGRHSGQWLTSVMLALRPELVEIPSVAADLAGEVAAASAQRGAAHLERFVADVVEQVRAVVAGRPSPAP